MVNPATTTQARRPARPTDRHGLALTTTAEAAAAFDRALDGLLALEDGALGWLERATDLDPGFALAHAVAATVLAEDGADGRAHLHAARAAAATATEREASFVTAALLWCSDGLHGDDALVRHVRRWPTDVCAVSLLTPSIASAGVAAGVVEVWPLLDSLVVDYGDDWWLTSIRAFARTEQHRFGEAEDLALAALEARPGSGHAAHAYAHALYETGRHQQAVAWIDGWRAGAGRSQRFAGHFSWHAALAQLAQGDVPGVRTRFDAELATLTGTRALVDAGSLLARCDAHGMPLGGARARRLSQTVAGVLVAPSSPFLAWHGALLAGLGADAELLDRGQAHARRRAAATGRPASERQAWAKVAVVCAALRAALGEDHARAAALLGSVGDTSALGGSPAQREVLQDLAVRELRAAGEEEAAAVIARDRLGRRWTAFDARVASGR